MTFFAVICILLIVVALAFVLPPLRHPERIDAASSTAEANVAVYRCQLAEMESDHRHQIITNEQFLRDREELERRLIADLPDDSRAKRTARPESGSTLLVYALAIGLPVTAFLLYLVLGSPPSLLPSP